VRQDNLSAATHQLAKTGGRGLTRRFADVVEHYGFDPSRIRPGESHENGVVEKAHHLLKSALEQALLLRGIRDFPSVEAYMAFVGQVVEETFHQGREARLAEERAVLKPLPSSRVPEYTRVVVDVRKWSTVPVAGHIYSVPSRLIGHEVEARVYADVVEIRYANKTVETMPRLRGESGHRIDYRHVIWSLVRKPGAFAAYRYREDLFPSLVFRRAYDALRERRGDRATWSTCGYCTWPRARASMRWRRRSRRCWSAARRSTTPRSRCWHSRQSRRCHSSTSACPTSGAMTRSWRRR